MFRALAVAGCCDPAVASGGDAEARLAALQRVQHAVARRLDLVQDAAARRWRSIECAVTWAFGLLALAWWLEPQGATDWAALVPGGIMALPLRDAARRLAAP
ncbi:MAG: hypothetical protein KatS3mg121_0608 [Gammaproteobacteria bacterium]|nr:MAG: hypothetical protein KatS3mg121_0608 [Gammaproteobacteria bacterium]